MVWFEKNLQGGRIALVIANRTIKAAEIARQAGVSRERVRQILEDLGYELQWRKKAKG